MKALRALMLVLALCVCTYAGDMPAGGVTGNMGNGVTGNMPMGVTGNIPTCITGNMATDVAGEMPTGVADPITEIGLTLFQSVLALF